MKICALNPKEGQNGEDYVELVVVIDLFLSTKKKIILLFFCFS